MAAARGWKPTVAMRASSRFETSGVSHHCSANSHKPPSCRLELHSTRPDAVWHSRSPSPIAAAPLRVVYGGTVENIHNYKAGGHSISKYLRCEFGNAINSSAAEGEERPLVTVFAVRDPLERFVSGVTEVLHRFVS